MGDHGQASTSEMFTINNYAKEREEEKTMSAKKVLGYRKFNSKTGKPCCIVTVSYPYPDRDLQYGACGNKTEESWIPEELQSIVTPQIIGKTAEFTYDVVNGRAYIREVSFK